MTNNEGMHAKSKSKVRRRYPALQLFRIEPEYGGCPETAARRGQPPAGTDRVGVVDQVSPPAKISFLMTAWTTPWENGNQTQYAVTAIRTIEKTKIVPASPTNDIALPIKLQRNSLLKLNTSVAG
jgi:hypothetical protein